MDTEIGHIADLLATTEADKTPLQKQLDGLSKIIATIAGIALVLVVILGLVRGESFDTLFITGVALAVAAIPTGLPAVVTALLSIGTREIARRHAIVKRLPAVETLGVDIGDLLGQDRHADAEQDDRPGAGDPGPATGSPSRARATATEGELKHVGGSRIDLDPYLLPMVLCADAVLDGEDLIGDPTEGALIVLAAKGGLDLAETRSAYPRIAEVPFDSDYKFMATFHNMTGAGRQAGGALLRQGRPGRADRPQPVLPGSRRDPCPDHRREPLAGPGGQRPHRRRRRAGDGGGPARPRPRRRSTLMGTCSAWSRT